MTGKAVFVFSVEFKGSKSCYVYPEDGTLETAKAMFLADRHEAWEVDDEDYVGDVTIYGDEGDEEEWAPSTEDQRKSKEWDKANPIPVLPGRHMRLEISDD